MRVIYYHGRRVSLNDWVNRSVDPKAIALKERILKANERNTRRNVQFLELAPPVFRFREESDSRSRYPNKRPCRIVGKDWVDTCLWLQVSPDMEPTPDQRRLQVDKQTTLGDLFDDLISEMEGEGLSFPDDLLTEVETWTAEKAFQETGIEMDELDTRVTNGHPEDPFHGRADGDYRWWAMTAREERAHQKHLVRPHGEPAFIRTRLPNGTIKIVDNRERVRGLWERYRVGRPYRVIERTSTGIIGFLELRDALGYLD